MEYLDILGDIISSNHYLCLATADRNAVPWSSPLAYVYDPKGGVFYFISHTESRHINNINENPQVSFSVYNSSQIPGNAFGIQGSGCVKMVESADVPGDLRGKLLSLVSMVILNRVYAFYAITVEEMYLPHIERWKEDQPIRELVVKNTR